ncbi:MAG: glycosyltransferase family 39 protein [Anaerolineales bacterium]|nr:glycosyltransferase family 39 protein [Anaerolineales bacterium]
MLALLVYLLVRLIGLSEFPIYFFTDEAVQTVLAADLIRDGFHGYDGVFLPTYFENAWLFNLSLSVYAQVLPLLLFGKSVFVTRATSVLIGISGAVAVALTLRDAFRLRNWWVGVLIFSAIPAWFLHSRTAFETVIFVALMAWALYFYLRYRQDNPKFLYAAVTFGGLSFYSYRGGQLVLIGFVVVLFLVDIRYHFAQRRTVLGATLLALIFTIPYLRFQALHREETYFHLRMLDTYWLHDISLREKVARFIEIYLSGLDPRFWLAPDGRDLSRHVMKGHGHISPFMAPFLIIGVVLSLKNIKQPPYRATLLLAVLSPLGAALVGLGITRVLIFVLPAALLTSIGILAVVNRVENRRLEHPLALLLFSVLLFFNSFMLRDALTNGPTWFQDYGLGGMQYGARQIFDKAGDLIEEDPGRTVYVSSTWANGTDILMRFFIPDGSSVHIGNADGFLDHEMELDPQTIFILPADEYQRLVQSPKVTRVEVLDTIPFPNGEAGFYVTTFAYSDQAQQIFAEEQAERALPRSGTTEWKGQTIEVKYPFLDMGELHHIFDEDTFTLARVHSANPAVFTLTFEKPTALAGLRLTTGSMDMKIGAYLYRQAEPEPGYFEARYTNLPDDPTVTLPFEGTVKDIVKLQVEILSLTGGDDVKIHIRELGWYTSPPVEG